MSLIAGGEIFPGCSGCVCISACLLVFGEFLTAGISFSLIYLMILNSPVRGCPPIPLHSVQGVSDEQPGLHPLPSHNLQMTKGEKHSIRTTPLPEQTSQGVSLEYPGLRPDPSHNAHSTITLFVSILSIIVIIVLGMVKFNCFNDFKYIKVKSSIQG